MSKSPISSPIIAIVGERGDGKTLLATGLATLYQKSGMSLISNYGFKSIPFRQMSFAQFVSEAEDIFDAVCVFDEFHVGADAYKWWNQKVNIITTFLTQLRKRNVILILTTQRFDTIASRARKLVDYIYQVEKGENEGDVYCEVHDMRLPNDEDFVRAFVFQGKDFFGEYDTNEIITSGDMGKKKTPKSEEKNVDPTPPAKKRTKVPKKVD